VARSIPFAAFVAVVVSAQACVAQDNRGAIEQGRYLVTAADCAGCHTGPAGKPFAGGRAIETPFGTIYSANITPDRETGIGGWDDEAFYNALHSGIGPGGAHYFPAFPYAYFTGLMREDVLAMRAYLLTLEPASSERHSPQLYWPLNYRFLMSGWNLLFFDEDTFRANAQKSAEWNRGAYLVQALGHCGACHTPKNWFGADRTGHSLEGGLVQDWFAPDITGNPRTGIGSWSVEELVEYLKTGHNARSDTTGLMAEVVSGSTSNLSEQDLRAIADYLKDQKGRPPEPSPSPAMETMKAGEVVYEGHCAACHESDGTGQPRMFTPLVDNANVRSVDATSLIRLVLEGGEALPTEAQPTAAAMTAYHARLDDEQIADVLSYVRNKWGNSAAPVSAAEVRLVRGRLGLPPK